MTEPIQAQLAQPAELHRYCRRCRRTLKAERAMKIGYGKICYAKVLQESKKGSGA
jgi:tRNA(Ile)-lysidine synthase TilS/MesJ